MRVATLLGSDPALPAVLLNAHYDVVPAMTEHWDFDPFAAEVKDGVLFGRGAADMKGAIAAFVAAAQRFIDKETLNGSISFLITGDEEGPSINGTKKVLQWMEENGEQIDVCIVGEPTNPTELGEMVKIGRRGSMNTIPDQIVIPLFFIIGASFGSFLNTVIYRVPEKISIIKPGSRCSSCKTPIRFTDNIPILGYFLLCGKCRICGDPFSMRYVLVEALTAILNICLYLIYGLNETFFMYLVLTYLLIAITFVDICLLYTSPRPRDRG